MVAQIMDTFFIIAYAYEGVEKMAWGRIETIKRKNFDEGNESRAKSYE